MTIIFDLQRSNKELLFLNVNLQLFYVFKLFHQKKDSSNDVSINISKCFLSHNSLLYCTVFRLKWPEQYIYTEDCSSNNQLRVRLQICLLYKHSLQHKDHLNPL